MEPIPVDHALRKLFAGLTEHAFMAELGVTDTRLIDYVTELLARFAQSRDETAFELLVWRHAALVQRICRSVLKDHHASEDAAQAG